MSKNAGTPCFHFGSRGFFVFVQKQPYGDKKIGNGVENMDKTGFHRI